MGVLVMRALLFGVYVRAPDLWKPLYMSNCSKVLQGNSHMAQVLHSFIHFVTHSFIHSCRDRAACREIAYR